MVPLYIPGSDVEVMVRCIGGAGVSGGADSRILKYWRTHFSSESEHLWDYLLLWEEWISNKHPPWESIWAMISFRYISLEKASIVCPVGIGGVICHFLAKCFLMVTGAMAT